MLLARPLAVFLYLSPFRFNWREKLFIAWTSLRRGRDLPGIDPMLRSPCRRPYLYSTSRLCRRHHLIVAAGMDAAGRRRGGCVALPRGPRPAPGRAGSAGRSSSSWSASVRPRSLYFRRGLIPSGSADAGDPRRPSSRRTRPIRSRPGTTSTCLPPPEKPRRWTALCRRPSAEHARSASCSATSSSPARHTLASLPRSCGVKVDEEQAKLTLADYFDIHLDRAPRRRGLRSTPSSVGAQHQQRQGSMWSFDCPRMMKSGGSACRGSSASCRRSGLRSGVISGFAAQATDHAAIVERSSPVISVTLPGGIALDRPRISRSTSRGDRSVPIIRAGYLQRRRDGAPDPFAGVAHATACRHDLFGCAKSGATAGSDPVRTAAGPAAESHAIANDSAAATAHTHHGDLPPACAY